MSARHLRQPAAQEGSSRESAPRRRLLSELPSLMAALPHLTTEELESFSQDLAATRAELNRAPDRDSWAS
jgi:hypothetical protein